MGTLQLIGLGMATVDILVRSTRSQGSDLFSPGAALEELVLDGGGMACNAMVAAQKLGIATGFVGAFGGDRMGQLKLQLLRDCGVDTSRITPRETPDDQWCRAHPRRGRRAQFSPGSHRTPPPVRPERARPGLPDPGRLLIARRYARGSGFAGGRRGCVPLENRSCWTQTPPTVRLRGHAPPGRSLRHPGLQRRVLPGPDRAGRTARGGAGSVGERPTDRGPDPGSRRLRYFAPETAFHTPAFTVPVIDTTGAGDVFHGAYLAALLEGRSLPGRRNLLRRAAAIKCQRMSRAGYPTRDEVLAFMRQAGRPLTQVPNTIPPSTEMTAPCT